MADIRIKDLATTATTTASDDFMAVDGAINGTRKLSAAAPAFLTSVTTPTLTAPAATDLTLAGGSSGASLVLGQGATAASSTITNTGTGSLSVVNGDYFNVLTLSRNSSATNTGTTIVFRSKDAGGTYVDVGAMFAAKSVATIGAVDSFLTWSTRRAGTLTDAMTLTATGNLVIGPTTSETGLTGAGGLKISSTTAGASNAGALVVAGGISAGNTGSAASYFGGKVNLATHTTSAGGIGFGTDTSLNRVTTGELSLDALSGTSSIFGFSLAGVRKSYLYWESATSTFYVGAEAAASSLIFLTANATALTINASKAATFAGAVSAASSLTAQTGIITGTNSAASYPLTVKNNALKAGASQYTGILIQTADASSVDLGLLYFTAVSATDRTWRLGAFDNANSTWSKGSFPGIISITDSAASTSSTTGALQVAGGIYAGAASVLNGFTSFNGGASIQGSTAAFRYLMFATGATNNGANAGRRYNVGVSTTAESGSNVGSDYEIRAYDDAGSPLRGGPDLLMTRSTGAATFAGAVTITGALKLGNAYVAGAVVGTGSITIQDSTGTTYRIPVLV